MLKFQDLKDFKEYRNLVDCATRSFLKLDGIEIPDGLTIDHILPVSLGFDMGIPYELISDPRNIQFIPRSQNSVKQDKCDIIPLFIQRWMIGHCSFYRKINQKENRLIGIKKAKERGVYKGRKNGTTESNEKFISKPKNKEALELLKLGHRGCRVSEMMNLNPNTVSKIKKIAKELNLL